MLFYVNIIVTARQANPIIDFSALSLARGRRSPTNQSQTSSPSLFKTLCVYTQVTGTTTGELCVLNYSSTNDRVLNCFVTFFLRCYSALGTGPRPRLTGGMKPRLANSGYSRVAQKVRNKRFQLMRSIRAPYSASIKAQIQHKAEGRQVQNSDISYCFLYTQMFCTTKQNAERANYLLEKNAVL